MKIDDRIQFRHCLADEPHAPLRPVMAIRPKDEKPWRIDCVHVTKRNGQHVAIATDMRQAVVVPIELTHNDVEGIFPLSAILDRSLCPANRVDGAFPKLDDTCVPKSEPVAIVRLDATRLLAVARALGSADRIVVEIRGGNDPLLVRACPPFGKPDKKGPLGVLMPIFGGEDCFPQGDSKRRAARRSRR